MKTNFGLVKYAQTALQEKWGYVWGTFGQVLTATLLQQKVNQYPSQVGANQAFIKQNWLNKRVTDCVGLIKSYIWWNNGRLVYKAEQDLNANMMYNQAKEKGTIGTIPEIPGVCVYKSGHIGVYIGKGQVIEARSTTRGVIQSPLKGSGAVAWTHWLKCPFIEYVEKGGINMSQEPSDWAKDAWEWAKKEGIFDGTNPKEGITREQVATVIHRLFLQGKMK